MRNLHYKIKGIRLSEEVWQILKEKRKKSGESWNVFLSKLFIKEDEYQQNNKGFRKVITRRKNRKYQRN